MKENLIPPHIGERLAQRFLQNDNLEIFQEIISNFFELEQEQQVRFLSYMAGAIMRYRQDLAIK